MKINELVMHKKLKSLGIGCISKVLSKKVRVNFGTEDCLTCDPKALEIIDTSHCKTVTFNQYCSKTMTNSDIIGNDVIVGNELKHYVGIGWITTRVVTAGDLSKYPRLVD